MGHRIKASLDYRRGPEKTWVYGALRVRDGKELSTSKHNGNVPGSIGCSLLCGYFLNTFSVELH
jgi:hypothetical protein